MKYPRLPHRRIGADILAEIPQTMRVICPRLIWGEALPLNTGKIDGSDRSLKVCLGP